jgi:hypothetical protein
MFIEVINSFDLNFFRFSSFNKTENEETMFI